MKTFSLDEAQSLLPVLELLLRRAIDAKANAEQLEAELQKLSQRIFFSGGMLIDTTRVAGQRESLHGAVQQAKDAVQEIESIGAQVKDLDTGLLDFPCRLGEEIVLLCWKLGESRIDHWHTMEAGFQGRQPLDERFLRSWPEKPN
jgi:hypothetical protein